MSHNDILKQLWAKGLPSQPNYELRAFIGDENIKRRKAPWATVVTVLDSPAAWGNGWLGMVGTLGIGTLGIGIVGFGANLKLPQRGDITNLQHAPFLKLKQWQE